MDYNKEGTTRIKKRTLQHGAGPRDVQRRQQQGDLHAIEDLQEQVKILTKQLGQAQINTAPSVVAAGTYTEDEFNESLAKEIEREATVIEGRISKEYAEKIIQANKETSLVKEGLVKAESEIAELRTEIVTERKLAEEFERKLENAKTTQGTSDDELNALINKATEDALKYAAESTNKQVSEALQIAADNANKQITIERGLVDAHKRNAEVAKQEISELKQELAVITEKLANKDELIDTLKMGQMTGDSIMTDIPSDRPQMETVFIDPTVKEDADSMESFISVDEDDHKEESEDMGNKLNKLKNLIGGLPKR